MLGIDAKLVEAEKRDLSGFSEKWRLRFDAIEKAGGDNIRWWKWPGAKSLTSKERRRIISNPVAGIWAILLGPVYYLYLGLWRKAITLTLIWVVLILIIGMVGDAMGASTGSLRALFLGVSFALFASRVNIDYYRKIVLKQKRWW